MRRSKGLWLVALLLSGAAQAVGRRVVVASGDCRDPDLLASTRLLTQELQGRVKEELFDEESFREQVAPPPTKDVDAISRQLDAARSLYDHNKDVRAEEQIKEVLAEVERLPPGRQRWTLTVRARLLHAVVLRQLDRPDLMDEAFRWVLRLDPARQLDPDDFSPGTLTRFERLRRQVLAGKRVRLEVKSYPAGAEVFLDGLSVGKTPYQANLPPSRYQVLVSKDGGTSLAHPVELKSPASVFVDLQFEGAIHPERAPCLSEAGEGAGSEAERLSRALKLGTVLGVEQVVLLRLERQGNAPGELVATTLDVHSARKGREGRLPVQNPARAPEGLGELADFILTGQPGNKVRTGALASAPAMVAPGTSPAVPPAAAPARVAPAPAPSRPAPGTSALASKAPAGGLSGRTWKARVALGSAAFGLLAGGAGALLQRGSAERWTEFNSYYAAGAARSRAQLPSVVDLRQQARAQHSLAVAGFVVGGAAIVGGAVFFLLEGPATGHGAPVSLRLSAGPTSVCLQGLFP